jgi:hypothetical protein
VSALASYASHGDKSGTVNFTAGLLRNCGMTQIENHILVPVLTGVGAYGLLNAPVERPAVT